MSGSIESVALVLAGSVLIVVVFLDALATTLVVGAGAGPLTRRVAGLLWRALLRLHRPDSDSWLLGLAGAGLLIATVLTWVGGLWLGWSCVFLGGDRAVVSATGGVPAGVDEVFYYAGFTVFTLGVGDFVAAGEPWRALTSVATFTGLFLVTLAITYLISVVSAVVNRRSVAARIHALGESAVDIVARGWTGRDFSAAFVQHLVSITAQLTVVAEQHLAYPVLHYFHSRNPHASAPLAVVRLDEAMLLLSVGVAPPARPHGSVTEPVRRAVERYVGTVNATSAVPDTSDGPPHPDLAALAARGLPVSDMDDFRRRVRAEEPRWRGLQDLLVSDGRSWPASGAADEAGR